MKCPNCGFNFSVGCRCPDCRVDVYVFRKARNASIRLYNEALTLAGETDLSGAAANLEQSLLFDKNNIQARNLLGLIYCETGASGMPSDIGLSAPPFCPKEMLPQAIWRICRKTPEKWKNAMTRCGCIIRRLPI